MSLQDFIAAQTFELIKRTRAKVAKRPSPQPTETELEHGVPVFLSQLTEALADEERAAARHLAGDPELEGPILGDIVRSARLHGRDLRKLGFTIEQVVHDYGDICQAVTELALQLDASVTTAEFHTLNRCLDNAIAGAVTAWNEERELARQDWPSDSWKKELLGLVESAIAAFDALRTGRVGAGGATAFVVGRCLAQMLALVKDSSPAR